MKELFKKVFHLEQNVKNIEAEIDILQSEKSVKEGELREAQKEMYHQMDGANILFVGNEGVYYLCQKNHAASTVSINNIAHFNLSVLWQKNYKTTIFRLGIHERRLTLKS